jgi:hypothetical protein
MVFDRETVQEYTESTQGRGSLRGEWRHNKSVSSAYWDPHGRSIVSTSYDDNLRRELCSCGQVSFSNSTVDSLEYPRLAV